MSAQAAKWPISVTLTIRGDRSMLATTDGSLSVTSPTAQTMDAAEHMPRYSNVKSAAGKPASKQTW